MFFLPEVDRTYYQSYSKWWRRVHDMCLHMSWDVVIAMVICLNVICMSLEHYQMSQVMRRNTKLKLKLHSWVHYDSCFSFWACDKCWLIFLQSILGSRFNSCYYFSPLLNTHPNFFTSLSALLACFFLARFIPHKPPTIWGWTFQYVM